MRRPLTTLAAIVRSPLAQLRLVAARGFEQRLTVVSVMQHVDNELTFTWRRSPVRPWRRALRSVAVPGKAAPSYLPVANRAARAFAAASGGRPLNLLAESVGAKSVTAHILGGAAIGADPEHGVVDATHEVFGHPGLYVADASAIPTNLGVNPSLTITALAERFAARFPAPDAPVAPGPSAAGAPLGPRSSQRVLRRAWSTLRAPTAAELAGDHEALFVGPPGFPALAHRGLGLVGLPRWFGKRFPTGAGSGTNLVRAAGGALDEVLPMRLALGPSHQDGLPCAAVTYGADAPLPWRFVRDELRVAGPGLLVGMTSVDVPGARRGSTPFLLRIAA